MADKQVVVSFRSISRSKVPLTPALPRSLGIPCCIILICEGEKIQPVRTERPGWEVQVTKETGGNHPAMAHAAWRETQDLEGRTYWYCEESKAVSPNNISLYSIRIHCTAYFLGPR